MKKNGKIKFAVGYQEPENGEDFLSIVEDYRGHISEIYFAWPGKASGRPALGKGREAECSIEELEYNISEIRKMGVKLDLLFNAACYGGKAASKELEKEVVTTAKRVIDVAGGLEIITTSSIAIAWIFKKHFPKVEVRASVNMKIGSPESMSYVSELFDSFHLQRDVQRNISHAMETKKWCKENGKKLCILANSGCLYYCPGQLFHDNLVAHDSEVSGKEGIDGFVPHVCWNLFKDPEKRSAILKATWIRPEDMKNYEGIADVAKLATRIHSNPRMVIDAYVNGRHDGNLLDLFEPTFSMALAPEIVSNSKFPDDWFRKTSTCGHKCHKCEYCDELYPKLLERL
ncbi:MAG TPA: hypothetical protein DCZ94_12455 [Lentisphaeria bacterium]|nr:MAG: hypothetical protein A2X48_03905 [Lentisphaerae bacterium GWF2_49_21]HBC87758.1 hypothetical protein [Lentisphaeria bacterium]